MIETIRSLFGEYSGLINLIESTAKMLAEYTKSNPVVGGIIMLWIIGIITFFTKKLPSQIAAIFKKQFTVSISISSQDKIFHHVAKWYDESGFGKKARTMRVNNGRYGWDKETTISAGWGNHYFMYKGLPFKMTRYKEQSNSDYVKEHITFTTIGRSQKPLRELVDSAIPKEKSKTEISVYNWEGEWKLLQKQAIRPLESVVLTDNVKKNVLDHIKNFKEDKDWYINNGIPYRTGIGFFGPPGTGKTSIVKALAGHFKKDLRILSLSLVTDKGLEKALSSVGDDSIVLIEDIDTFGSVNARNLNFDTSNLNIDTDEEKVESGEPKLAANNKREEKGFLTLSGILNAVDGVASSDGRILIVTTNDLDSIDAALLRPGRIDLVQKLGYLCDETFRSMFKRFYPDFELPEDINFKKSVTPAFFQNLVRINRKDPKAVLEKITEDKEESDEQEKVSASNF